MLKKNNENNIDICDAFLNDVLEKALLEPPVKVHHKTTIIHYLIELCNCPTLLLCIRIIFHLFKIWFHHCSHKILELDLKIHIYFYKYSLVLKCTHTILYNLKESPIFQKHILVTIVTKLVCDQLKRNDITFGVHPRVFLAFVASPWSWSTSVGR